MILQIDTSANLLYFDPKFPLYLSENREICDIFH